MKYLLLDTNILLLDANNIVNLGNPDTIIVIPETVMEEMDSKKSGLNELAYQARSFGRILAKAEILGVTKDASVTITTMLVEELVVKVIALNKYDIDTASDSKNDQKIQAVAKYIQKTGSDVVVMSNDVMMRLRCMADGLEVTDLKIVEDTAYEFIKELTIEDPDVFRTLHNKNILDVDSEYTMENYSYKFTSSVTTQTKLATIHNGYISVLGKETESEIRRQDCAPQNSEQLLVSKAILDPMMDLVLIEGLAGSGKNITAVSNAIKLVKTTKDKYESIIYIRSPQNDESLGEDVGYLSTNEAKYAMYLGPMEDTLDFIIRSNVNSKGVKKQELEDRVADRTQKLINDCGIESMISTGLRGKTFHDSIIIIDEAQNTSPATMQKILTRVGKDCKVIVIGSNKQIDNKYITKYNNGFTVMLDEAKTRKIGTDLTMFAIELHKVQRSEMCEFAENVFSSKG